MWRNSQPSLPKTHKIGSVILRVTEKKRKEDVKGNILSSITKYDKNMEETAGLLMEFWAMCPHKRGRMQRKNQQTLTEPAHPLIHTPSCWENTDSQSTGCLVRLGDKTRGSVNIYWVFIEFQLDRTALFVLLILLIVQYAAFVHLFLLTILSSTDI